MRRAPVEQIGRTRPEGSAPSIVLSDRLAIDGGPPVRSSPVPPWPSFDAGDQEAVRAVLESGRVNYWTGEQGRLFEKEFARFAGVEYAVAVANGTTALEIALHALGIGAGDEVVVPAATFVATASAVVARGARPVVVDVERSSQCLSAATVEPAITERTRAVIVVHLGGHPVEMAPILDLARERGLFVVEDCAQAHGARREGRSVGSFGHIAAWSFCQDKIMTTGGEGGAITTDDEKLWRRCWEQKDHGKSWSEVHRGSHAPGFRWLHHRFGTNSRMTEMQAAIGRTQLHKIETWSSTRRRHGAALREALDPLRCLRLTETDTQSDHAYYRFSGFLDASRLKDGWDRDRFVASVAAEGVPCLHGGCPEIQREVAFDRFPAQQEHLPVAAELGRSSFALLVHPTLRDADVDDVASAVRKVALAASR